VKNKDAPLFDLGFWLAIAAVVGYAVAVLVGASLAAGCSTVETAGGDVTEFVACPTNLIDCGHVYLCEQAAENALGHVEVCIDDDTDGQLELAERAYGACVPTPRHQGLCSYHCDGGKGCNGFDGCFCPEVP
jgi:predicted small secreted protein